MKVNRQNLESCRLTSLSDVPQRAHDLHSRHCHRYFFIDITILGVNWRQVGWADRPQSKHDTIFSAAFVFLFSSESPRQKSQYLFGVAFSSFALGSRERDSKHENLALIIDSYPNLPQLTVRCIIYWSAA